MLRILFYNWVDYLDDEKRGGGVSIYQRNLIRQFDAREDVECLFLSSGISYDVFPAPPRWEQVRHGPAEDRHRRYEIVNSGVLSPGHLSFGNAAQVDQPDTVEVFFDFLRRKGPFDVVHFNNFEGLPVSVLKLKEAFPQTRVIFSMHNYYPVCPQVNLWYQERENCTDYDKGRKCADCLPHRVDPRIVRLADAVAYVLKKRGIRPGTRLFDGAFGPGMRLAGRALRFYQRRVRQPFSPSGPLPRQRGPLRQLEGPGLAFRRRREEITRYINTYCDAVLCVSGRVGEVARRFGISERIIRTCYIGTREAQKFHETTSRPALCKPDGTLTIAYLGYMRRDKGFYFLLDALEAMPDDMAARIEVVLAARMADQATMDRVTRLGDRFRAVFHTDGYTHDGLDAILADVDVGIVPPLWEDNLPQVAIEMHARHIPLLTSDRGGAQELGRCPEMVFKAGDVADFHRRIKAVLDGRIDAGSYWAGAIPPRSMEDHVEELIAIYTEPLRLPPEERVAVSGGGG